MIPAAFDYVRAGSAEEAISLLGEHGDEAKFLAGGHSLLPLMKLRLAQPSGAHRHRSAVSDLSYIRDAGDHIAIGALTRHADVETSDVLAEHVPLLAHAASHVGDPQVRHRGTIGGSIAHADPASDLPATTLALGATYVAQGPGGTREIAAADFYEASSRRRWHPTSCSPRSASPRCRAPDGASRSSTAGPRTGPSSVSPPGGATVTPGSALVNMGSTPILATSVSSALPSGASIEDAAEQAVAEADPQADLNASVEYRTHLAKVLTRRALEAASS